MTLYPWLVGTEIIGVRGGYEQASGFEYKPGGRLDSVMAELEARTSEVATFASDNGLSASGCETRLVARGALALALLLKGEWIEAPAETEDDPDALGEWLQNSEEPTAAPSTGRVGYRYGTKGSSQAPFPGVVHGICIEGADATSEPVAFSAVFDAQLDEKLKAAGIEKPRYFLITQYD